MAVQECHFKSVDHISSELETHLERGLTQAHAKERLEKYGPNELQEKPRPGFLSMLLAQFNNFLVIILIVAAVVSILLGEYVDAIAILIIVALNAVVGVVQESKAEAALAALKKMSAPNAQVIRDGHQITIPSRELVLGDAVLMEAGNYVPADMRLIESINLKVEEASLTGESVPVDKKANVVLDKDIPIGDRKNSAFMSTLVTYGRGKGLVTSTGMHTQIGMIAEMLQSYEEESGEEKGEKTWRMVADPTEGAMVVAAAKIGLWRKELERIIPRVQEIPFDSDRKRMTTIHQLKGTPSFCEAMIHTMKERSHD